jgi:hypothetical protein
MLQMELTYSYHCKLIILPVFCISIHGPIGKNWGLLIMTHSNFTAKWGSHPGSGALGPIRTEDSHSTSQHPDCNFMRDPGPEAANWAVPPYLTETMREQMLSVVLSLIFEVFWYAARHCGRYYLWHYDMVVKIKKYHHWLYGAYEQLMS